MALATRAQTGYTILGIGQNVAQAFTPYTTTIHGQHIAIIAATQVIDSDLQTAWTATATQPGLASAYDVNDLVAAVEAARKTADTVIVYLHWGTELDACPNPLQEPLAQVLVQAGADIIVGTHAHVLLGGGYLGSAYVDYGLGQLRLLRQLAAGERQWLAGDHGHRPPHRPGHVAAGGDRRRPAAAPFGRRRDRGAGGVEPGPACTNVSVTPTAPVASAQTESSPGAGGRCRQTRLTPATRWSIGRRRAGAGSQLDRCA